MHFIYRELFAIAINLTFVHNNSFPDAAPIQTSIRNSTFPVKNWKPIVFHKQPDIDEKVCQEVIANVNEKLAHNAEGRLFAVVHLCGKQFKVTAGDILMIEGYWPPSIGDKLKLEKVQLIWCSAYGQFTKIHIVETGAASRR